MTEKTVETGRKKKSRFGLGLLIYAWILLMIGGGLLFVLNDYLIAYEQSQVKYCLSDYRDGLEKTLPAAAVQALGDLDSAVQSPEENQAWALEQLQGAYLSYDAADSADDRLVYWIKRADGGWIGTVVFGVTEHGRYGVPVWEPVEEQYDFSPFYQTAGITVPPDYSVYLGGRLLGADCIVETGIPYDALEECYHHYSALPAMVRYESVPFAGEPELRVLDENGRELKPEELDQAHFLFRCSPEDRAAVEAFIPEFMHDYIYYSADIGGGALRWYYELRAQVVPGSQLNTRINQAVESFGYSNTKDLDILFIEVRDVADLGGGLLLADVHYKTVITALNGPVEVEDQAQVVLRWVDGELLADALYHY